MSAADHKNQPEQGAVRARVRGCVGSVLSGGLGCLSFVVGATLAIVLFAPQLLSTYGAQVLVQVIEGRIEGSAEVHDVRLSWSKPQRAESVSIFTAQGERLMDGSVEFPSILELLADEGRRGRIKIQVRELRSGVGESGGGDLARVLRLAPSPVDRSVVAGLVADLSEWLRETPGLGERDRLIDFAVTVDKAIFEGDGDRGAAAEVSVTGLDVVGRIDGDRLTLDLDSCEIGAQEIPAAEGVSWVRGELDLTAGSLPERLELESGPLPVAVLRTLGLLGPAASSGRPLESFGRPRPAIRGDLFDATARGLLGMGDGMAEGGIEVQRLSVGPDPDGDGSRRGLELEASCAAGSISLRAILEDAGNVVVLTPAEPLPSNEGFPFTLAWSSPDPAAPARWIEPILPDGLRVDGGERAAKVRAFSSAFRLTWPLARSDRGLEGALAACLRGGDLELKLAEGAPGETVAIVASTEDRVGTAGTWRLEHRFTDVRLMGDMGGAVESFWRGTDGELSLVRIRIPGAVLPGDTRRTETSVDLRLHRIPTRLLEGWAAWPESVGALLPGSVSRLEVAGIPAEHWLDPEPMRRYELALDLELEPGSSFEATIREEELETAGGILSLPVNDEVVSHLLLGPMPWLEACRISRREADRGQGPLHITVTLEDLRFDALEGKDLVARRIVINLPPLEVRLCRSLEREILGGQRGWLGWAPGRIEYSLDRGEASFQSVELPLGSEESALMSGTSEDGEFDLTGPVEVRFLPGSIDPTGGAVESIQVSFRGDDEEVSLGIVLPSLRDLDLRALGIGR